MNICDSISCDNFLFDFISTHDIDDILIIEKICYNYPWNRQNVINEISNENSHNLCIKSSSGNLIGYCFTYIVLDEMFLTNICIHPRFQKNGFGKMLVKEIISKAKNFNIQKIFLEVRENNFPAYNLYLKMGFEVDCLRKKFYDNGDSAYLMHLKLS